MGKAKQLREWLEKIPDEADLTFHCSIYDDDAMISALGIDGEYHDTQEIEGFHKEYKRSY